MSQSRSNSDKRRNVLSLLKINLDLLVTALLSAQYSSENDLPKSVQLI